MKKLLKLFRIRRPAITGRLVKRATKVKVKLINCHPENAVIIMYSMVNQVANMLGYDKRQFMNKIIALDKQIERTEKRKTKKKRYNK